MSGSNTFSLEGQSLKLDTAADLEPHIVPLLSSTAAEQIKHINLSGNTIGVEAAQSLSSHLSKLNALESANLADIFTSRLLSEIPLALDALLSGLLPLKQLHTVNLSDNAFGLKTQAPLVKFLERHKPLRHLILNNNGLGPEAGAKIADALTRLADAKTQDESSKGIFLETIVCGRNRLESGSAQAWAKALAAHASTLREVRMTQNGIRVEGIQKLLLDGLRHANHLEVLDLQDNLFTLPGAQALVAVVQGWSKLKELAIQDTLLRARGAIIVAETLAKGQNKQLEALRLQYNEVNAQGIKALVVAVKSGALPNLKRVELNGNKFSEDDPSIEFLSETLNERKESSGVGEDAEDDWGLDELDELDDESEEEEGDDQEVEDDEVEDKADRELKLADEEEDENVAQEKDDEVDALADKIAGTHV